METQKEILKNVFFFVHTMKLSGGQCSFGPHGQTVETWNKSFCVPKMNEGEKNEQNLKNFSVNYPLKSSSSQTFLLNCPADLLNFISHCILFIFLLIIFF